MPNVVGTPIVNPTYGAPTVAETNEYLLAATTLNAPLTASATSATLTNAATFSVDNWLIIDSGTLAECVQITSINSSTVTFYPAVKNAHSNGVAVILKVQRQVFALGPNKKTVLTTSSPLSATSISTVTGSLVGIINTSISQTNQPVVSFFDEGASPTGAAADLIYACSLGASQVITFPGPGIPFYQGLAYSLAGTPLSNIVFVWN